MASADLVSLFPGCISDLDTGFHHTRLLLAMLNDDGDYEDQVDVGYSKFLDLGAKHRRDLSCVEKT